MRLTRHTITLLAATWLLNAFGCQGPTAPAAKPLTAPKECSATAGDAALTLMLCLPEGGRYETNQALPVLLIATNHSESDIRFRHSTTSEFTLYLCRFDGLGWRRIKTYPEAAKRVLTEWVLPAGQTRVFRTSLPVEPDWPTSETVRLEAYLNGRENVCPAVHLEIVPPKRK